MGFKFCQPAGGRAGALLSALSAVLVIAAACPAAAADHELCNGEPTRINVVVEGLRSAHGDIVVEIYPDDAKRFLARKAQVNSIHVKLESRTAAVCLPVPKPGGYAVAIFHDENGDGEFNRNVLGIPSEGFGLSNNPTIHLRMPSFQAVRFEAGDGETTLHVRLHYILGGSSPR
jgi:uncharacterized protein (DUF2141 family)